jgi:hypothetical protein
MEIWGIYWVTDYQLLKQDRDIWKYWECIEWQTTSFWSRTVLYGISKRWRCPATRHERAREESRYSSYSFSTSALDGCEWSASGLGRALLPGKGLPVPIVQEAGWAPEPVWTQRLEAKSSASVGDRTPIVQSVVRHYTDLATPAPIWNKWH